MFGGFGRAGILPPTRPIGPSGFGGGMAPRVIGALKKGTKKVKKTGAYKLHKGEAVLTKEQAKKRFKTESNAYNFRQHRGGRKPGR